MLPATLPQFDPKHLFRRLARLRRRQRLVTLLDGAFALVAILVGGIAYLGLVDYRWPLPSLVRAIGLVGILTLAGYLLIRRLIVPLRRPVDNFHLALDLEEKNPELNDALASAVQFLDQSAEDETSSPLMRRVTIRNAVRLAEDVSFNELIPLGGLFQSFVGALIALAVAIPALVYSPASSRTAIARVLMPFGAREWPAQTQIRVLSPASFPHRHPLGESLEIRAEVTGVIPERATLILWYEGAPPVESTWVVDRAANGDLGSLVARLEPSKLQRSFRFRVKAEDGTTPWHDVEVLPPPELVPLDGRPSPQISLEFPPYTDLKPRQLRDGGSDFEAVAGTQVRLRAMTNRPVARSWIVYRPEMPVLNTSAALLPLTASRPFDSLIGHAAGRAVWERIPIHLGRDGTLIDVTFTPRVGGVYALRFEDETGFGATRQIDITVLADPAPTVTLDRPSASHDSLSVTPAAMLPLRSTINDPMYAIRGAWLEYRTAKDQSPRARTQFDHRAPGRALSAPIRLRLATVLIQGRLQVAQLKHPDGSALKENDSVVIQMVADDFDDVTGMKEPGRSHELELRIVSPATLEAMLQQEQANVRTNLLRLQQWQKEAREKVSDAKLQQDNTGKLRPEDLEKLLQAEQLQQQIQARIGNEKEGLRAEVNRIRSAQKDNQLPASAAQSRMDAVANELERLAREELESIEPLLNAAREAVDPMKRELQKADPSKGMPQKGEPQKGEPQKGEPQKGEPQKGAPQKGELQKGEPQKGEPQKGEPQKGEPQKGEPQKGEPQKGEPQKGEPQKPTPSSAAPERRQEPLGEAMRHQKEVEQTLEQLLQRLEPWSGANEVRGETRALLNEQEKLQKETEQLDQRTGDGSRERLDEQQRADLDRAAAKQEALAEQLKGLMDKMERLAAEKQNQERERLKTAEELEKQAQEREQQAQNQKGTPQGQQARTEAERLHQQAEDQKSAAQNLKKEADALKDAARTARQELSQDKAGSPQQTKMHEAAQEMKQNRLGKAQEQQKETARALNKMLDRLEERRTDDLDRLAKKMRDTEQKLDELVDQQERLQKKVKDAQNISGAEQRKQELERLAREQERLQEEAKDLLQELSRLKADGAAQALSRAAREMNDAQQRMERGEKADESQENALEKLDQAQDQMEQARKQIEEELLREKVEKAAERVKAIRERQAAFNKETQRLHDTAGKAKRWDDAVLRSLSDQIDAERGLAGELDKLVEGQFKPIKVAAKMLEHSADAMKLAAERIEARREDVKNRAVDEPWDELLETKLHGDVVKWQQTALRRLDQFLEALKPENDPKQLGGGGGPGGGAGGGGGGGRRGGDEIPLLAQLKALRSLQAEVNERTAEFARKHPDLSKLDEAAQSELSQIRKMQRDIADLIAEYSVKDEGNEGGKP